MNPSDPRESLSERGAARHLQILAAAYWEADRRRRKRVVRRGIVSVCIAGLIVTSAVILRPRTRPIASIIKKEPATHPTIVSRASISPIAATQEDLHWEAIDDDQLLAALAESGKPSGIIRLNGRTEIVPQ